MSSVLSFFLAWTLDVSAILSDNLTNIGYEPMKAFTPGDLVGMVEPQKMERKNYKNCRNNWRGGVPSMQEAASTYLAQDVDDIAVLDG